MKKIFNKSVLSLLAFALSSKIMSANELVTLLDTTSTNGISATSDIMATPLGSIVYFIIGLLFVSTVVGVIVGTLKWGKGNT